MPPTRSYAPLRSALAAVFAIAALVLSAPGASAQSEVDRIDALVTKYSDLHLFNGAVLVAEDGRAIYERGFGNAVMEFDVPNTPRTRFRIGSVTKQFTAAIVLQLVEEGKIDLQAPITRYLHEYPAGQGERVTIHHLLTHTSGIPSYTDLPGFMEGPVRKAYVPADSLLPVFWEMELEFEAGSRWSYNNSGYHILGVIIERVTGQPYDRVLRERILEPIGLHDTGYDHNAEVVDERAFGYERVAGGYRHAPFLDSSIPFSAGMMYSTVEDLLIWDQALYGQGPFRNPETRELYFTPHVAMASADGPHYAYGWILRDVAVGSDTVRLVEHGGGIFGFTTEFWRMPDDRRTIILIDNTSGTRNDQIMRGILAILHDQVPEEPRRPVQDYVAEIIETRGIEAALAAYRALSDSAPERYDMGEDQLNELGYVYLRRGDVATAVSLFELNVERFPEAANPYDSLGEAYLEAGDRERAIENYRKSLDRNPANDNARRILAERLGVEVEVATFDVPDEALDAYVGRFELQPGFVVEITRVDEGLAAQATAQPRFPLVAISATEFVVRGVDARLEFHREGTGRAESLTLRQGGQEVRAPRID